VKIAFAIDHSGEIRDLKVVSNTSNPEFERLCSESIYEAAIKPPPENMAGLMKNVILKTDLNFNYVSSAPNSTNWLR
jgi:outer membrane biosynthesis protein TonB